MTVWTTLGSALSPMLRGASSVLPKPDLQPVRLPRRAPLPSETSPAEIERIVERLDSHKEEWLRVTTSERAELLQACVDTLIATFGPLSEVSTNIKGSWGQGNGEEGFCVLACILSLQEYAATMMAGGRPKPLALNTRPNGQQVAQVFPNGLVGILFPGFRGEVWIEPGKPATQGRAYRQKERGDVGPGAVSLILGAGNQMGVIVLDVLHKLLADDEVAIVKMNPVNGAIGPCLREGLKPLVDRGFLEFTYGGKEVAELLINHPKVQSVHLTGSADTYNAIMWGSPTAQRTGKPLLGKELTAELGCVSPHILVPGEWSAAELEHQASNVIAGLAHNSGHNCVKPEVILTAADWPQRRQFLDVLRRQLQETLQRKPWYPGSDAKYAAFKRRFPQAEALGKAGSPETLPWLLTAGLAPGEACVDVENWCGVVQEVALPNTGTSAAAFMEAAEEFVNNKLWGTLSCCVIIDPRTQRENAAAFDTFISKLRYGLIAVNVLALVGFANSSLAWGAFPGNTPQDIGSGVGFVHNSLLFDHVQKSVLYGSWMFHPTPFWWPNHRNLETTVPLALGFARNLHKPILALWHVTFTALAAVRG